MWSVQDGWDRLRLEATRPSADDFDLAGLKFHPAVASGRKCLPCSTTPAPDENGRPAPRNQRGSVPPDAKDRWLADKRQFAPWNYTREALMEDDLVIICSKLSKQYSIYLRGTIYGVTPKQGLFMFGKAHLTAVAMLLTGT